MLGSPNRPPTGPTLKIHRAGDGCSDPALAAAVPPPSTGRFMIGNRPATLSIWPARTWTMMDFPEGVSRASGGEWFAARVD